MNLYGNMQVRNHHLTIAGVDLVQLAQDWGTPLIVLDEATIRKNIRDYYQSMQENYSQFRILYASKAFLNRTLCRILEEEGAGIDVVSGGELYIALKAGFPPERIFFHGNNKSRQELELALENNIGRIVIDNQDEAFVLEEIARRMKKKVNVLLRLNPGIHAHTHEFMQTGIEDSKFGLGIVNGQALKLIKKLANSEYLNLTGVHAHIGSQIFDYAPYFKLVEVLFDFLLKIKEETGLSLKEMDLGGGLGIGSAEIIVTDFITQLSSKVKKEAAKRDLPLPELILEPGRSIIGTAGTTLYTVGTIKDLPGIRKYIAVDGGISDNIRPALYGAKYEALLVNDFNRSGREKVTIAGKNCESGDILIKDIELPPLKQGDILAILHTGAYTYAMASNYNGLPRPAVVLLKDGEARLVNRRESYQDLLNCDLIPEEYEK